MKTTISSFDEHEVLHHLKHYLPAQAPLKDFVHHNTLHAFQQKNFEHALVEASTIFGYNTTLSLEDYRSLYKKGRINDQVLIAVLKDRKGPEVQYWKDLMLHAEFVDSELPRLGQLRGFWKRNHKIDIDAMVHPLLFRIIGSYLDQGISIWNFPVTGQSFIESLRTLEEKSFHSFFNGKRAKQLLLNPRTELEDLLSLLVGDEKWYEQYLYDQQFSHQGWSGMVSAIEDQPQSLLDRKIISLHDFIFFECLLEIDALDRHNGSNWQPLAYSIPDTITPLFADVHVHEYDEIIFLWQQAFEWSFYDEVLAGIQKSTAAEFSGSEDKKSQLVQQAGHSFQAFFCIDDRECSFRRYVEELDPRSATYGTPGFFGVEFFYQPQDGKFYDKLCPAPVTPKYLIKAIGKSDTRKKDIHFEKHSHSLHSGWLISQTVGFWSALKLFAQIFRPSTTPATALSFKHMDKISQLTIVNEGPEHTENGLQIGFTVEEMTNRVEGVLRSTGLVDNFAPIVYVVGHGASSVNNPHFSAYDCGACCGRPGSVNARVFSAMANNEDVRAQLRTRGIDIPEHTQFIGALHDTTRDDIEFFDEHLLSETNALSHKNNVRTFEHALDFNAKERSRRFESIDSTLSPETIHQLVQRRSVSLFEPRPELNHATNALCIVGRREMSKNIFLDRRSFLNSYNYAIDPDGTYLLNILRAAAPVCGGINLEYFFSRVDNQKLGAGTKLPHNVMGLIGVANGTDGDLRPGLPNQMIEVHDPVRLLIIVEHFPEVLLKTIQSHDPTYEWFVNEWVNLVAVNPETKETYRFKKGKFELYHSHVTELPVSNNLAKLVESHQENFPVHLISKN